MSRRQRSVPSSSRRESPSHPRALGRPKPRLLPGPHLVGLLLGLSAGLPSAFALVAPGLGAITETEASGSAVAVADGQAQAGETMSVQVVVTNNDTVSQTISVSMTATDPFGQVTATSTSLTLGAGASATTAANALKIAVRQDTPCGHRLGIALHAWLNVSPSFETWSTTGLLVGVPASPAPVAYEGPLHLRNLSQGVIRGCWKTDAPQKFGAVESASAGSVILRVYRADGEEEIYNGTTVAATGASARIARADDGWGVAYLRSGNVYFRKYNDTGGFAAEQLVDSSGTETDYNATIAYDSNAGFLVGYCRSVTASSTYSYYVRRIPTAGTSVSTELSLGLSLTGNAAIYLISPGLSGGSSPNQYSYFGVYYGAGAGLLRMIRLYYYEPGSLSSPGVFASSLVEDISATGLRIDEVRVERSVSDGGRFQYVGYSVYEPSSVSHPYLYYRQVRCDATASTGARLTVLATGSTFSVPIDLEFNLVRRGADNDLSFLIRSDGSISASQLQEQLVSGDSTPTLNGPLVSMTPYYDSGRIHDPVLCYIAPSRIIATFTGSWDANSINWFSWQTADRNTFGVPALDQPPILTPLSDRYASASAVAGDRVGLLEYSNMEGGFRFRILASDGSPAPGLDPTSLPWRLLLPDTAGTGSYHEYMAVASDGTDFLVMFRGVSDTQLRFYRIDGRTGLVLAGPAFLPVNVALENNIRPSLAWTGSRYRYVVGDDPGTTVFNYYTGTITSAGAHEPANRVLLGSLSKLPGAYDPTPHVACNVLGNCFVTFGTSLRTMTTLTAFNSRTLASSAILAGSDGVHGMILRSDGSLERVWPSGTQRNVTATIADWTGTPLEYLGLSFDGEGYSLVRVGATAHQPIVQLFDTSGAARPGFTPSGEFPMASYAQSALAAWWTSSSGVLSDGGGYLLLFSDSDDDSREDLSFVRYALPAAALTTCGQVANTAPTTSAGGPYTLDVRPGGSPFVLTDGQQPAEPGDLPDRSREPRRLPISAERLVAAGWDFNGDGVVDRRLAEPPSRRRRDAGGVDGRPHLGRAPRFRFPDQHDHLQLPGPLLRHRSARGDRVLAGVGHDGRPGAADRSADDPQTAGRPGPEPRSQNVTWAAVDNVATGGSTSPTSPREAICPTPRCRRRLPRAPGPTSPSTFRPPRSP